MKKYLPLLILTPFFLLTLRLINNDFWYDEYYMLHHRVFSSFYEITMAYNSINTHQLLALWSNLLMKLQGAELEYLLDNPFILRAPQLLITGITIRYLYLICRRHYNQATGLVAITILLTTLPYYYYATQIRGYSLSIMFMTVILYFVFLNEHRIILIPLVVLFVYTMCSNYCFIIIMLGYLILIKSKSWRYLLTGALVGIVLYMPLLNGMMNDPFVNSHSIAHSKDTLFNVSQEVFYGFISYRWLLLPMAILGGIKQWKLDTITRLCMSMIIVPFFLFALCGSKTYGRFFLPALPCFCILIAAEIEYGGYNLVYGGSKNENCRN